MIIVGNFSDAAKVMARRFIQEHYDEKELIPLCGIAYMCDPIHKWYRPLYRDFSLLPQDVQSAIFGYLGLTNPCERYDSDKVFYSEYMDLVIKSLKDFEPILKTGSSLSSVISNKKDEMLELYWDTFSIASMCSNLKPDWFTESYTDISFDDVRTFVANLLDDNFSRDSELEGKVISSDFWRVFSTKEEISHPLLFLNFVTVLMIAVVQKIRKKAVSLDCRVADITKKDNENWRHLEHYLEHDDSHAEDIFLFMLYGVWLNLHDMFGDLRG